MILLLWVYYSCQIVLFGAEFTRAYALRQSARADMNHSLNRISIEGSRT